MFGVGRGGCGEFRVSIDEWRGGWIERVVIEHM